MTVPALAWTSRDVGKPGSSRAVAHGCCCNQILNFFGRGDEGGLFKIAPACRLHGNGADPTQCHKCGSQLERVGRKPRRFACPNQCTPAEDLPRTTRRPAIGLVRADADVWKCPRCDGPMEMRRGRPPKACEKCLTPSERRHRDYMREWNKGRRP